MYDQNVRVGSSNLILSKDCVRSSAGHPPTKETHSLLTRDLDFSELVAASGAKLSGVVIFCLRNMRTERVKDYLGRIISQYRDALEQDTIGVTQGQVRVRLLPVKTSE